MRLTNNCLKRLRKLVKSYCDNMVKQGQVKKVLALLKAERIRILKGVRDEAS